MRPVAIAWADNPLLPRPRDRELGGGDAPLSEPWAPHRSATHRTALATAGDEDELRVAPCRGLRTRAETGGKGGRGSPENNNTTVLINDVKQDRD